MSPTEAVAQRVYNLISLPTWNSLLFSPLWSRLVVVVVTVNRTEEEEEEGRKDELLAGGGGGGGATGESSEKS